MRADASRANSYLEAQRHAVLSIVEGMPMPLQQCSIVPSGWTVDSLLRHLASAERYWCQVVIGGLEPPPPRPEQSGRNFYIEAVCESREVIRGADLDSSVKGQPSPEDESAVDGTVESVLLHLMEETARHAGHLDIARELLDGRTGLGPR